MVEYYYVYDYDYYVDKEFGGYIVKDLVCGMVVDLYIVEYCSQYGGKIWYFCLLCCQFKFDEDFEQCFDWEKKQ